MYYVKFAEVLSCVGESVLLKWRKLALQKQSTIIVNFIKHRSIEDQTDQTHSHLCKPFPPENSGVNEIRKSAAETLNERGTATLRMWKFLNLLKTD